MRYKVENEIFNDIDDAIDYCITDDYHCDDDYFEEWVNDNWGYIEINGYDYYAYDVLNNAGDLDNVLCDFEERMNESDREEAEYALRHSNIGDYVTCQAYDIEIIDDDEDESGDSDGDDKIEMTRKFIEEQKQLVETAKEQEKKHDADFMELFQVITND